MISLKHVKQAYHSGSVKRYAGNTVWIFLNQIISGLALLVLSVVVARYVDKNTYGTYKYIVAGASLIGMVSLTGISVATMRSAARGYEAALLSGTKLYLKYAWLAVLISIATGLYYLIEGNHVFGWLFIVCGFLYPLFFITQAYNNYLSALKDFKLATLYNSPASILSAVSLGIVALTIPKVAPLVLVYFGASIIYHGVFLLKTIRDHNQTENQEESVKLLDQAKHNSINNLISAVVANIDKLIVFQFIGAIPLALYTFATTIPEFLKAFTKSINTVFFSSISKQDNSHHLKYISAASIVATIITAGFISIAYAVSAKIIFQTLYPNYIEAIKPSILYSITIVTSAVLLSITNIVQARANTKLIYSSNIDSSVIQLVCLVVVATMSPTIIGIVTARIVGQGLSGLWLITVVWRKYKHL